MKIKHFYEDGVCPECGEEISDDAQAGDECYKCGYQWSNLAEWDVLSQQVKDDLLAWFNGDPNSRQKILLAQLYNNGNFHAWNCPVCGERVYWGDPDDKDWGDFQGVCQADYTTYPGNTETYNKRIISQMCDSCRSKHSPRHELNLVGFGEPSCWAFEEE